MNNEQPPTLLQTFEQINSLLTVIVGHAQLLERRIVRGDEVTPESIAATLRLIQRAGHLAALEAHRSRLPDS